MTPEEWATTDRATRMCGSLPNRRPDLRAADAVYNRLAGALLRLAPAPCQEHLAEPIRVLEEGPADAAWVHHELARLGNGDTPGRPAHAARAPAREYARRRGRQGVYHLLLALWPLYRGPGVTQEKFRAAVWPRAAGFIRDAFPLPAGDGAARAAPLAPPPIPAYWVTAAAAALAGRAATANDFSALPVLADALEEVGCDRADVLTHLRGPGPHSRACWVVRAVLARRLPDPGAAPAGPPAPAVVGVGVDWLVGLRDVISASRRALAAGEVAGCRDRLAVAGTAVCGVLEQLGVVAPPESTPNTPGDDT